MKRFLLNSEAIIGYILLILAIVFGALSFNFPKGYQEPGPSFFPIIVSIGLLISITVIIFKAHKEQKNAKEKSRSLELSKKHGLLILYLFLYLIGMPYAGFIICSLVFMFFVSRLYGFTGIVQPTVFSVVAVAALYLIFYIFLKIPLNIL